MKLVKPGEGNDFYRMNGVGEMLVFSAADFEQFFAPRPDLDVVMEEDPRKVVRLLAENRWPFRIHATYDFSVPEEGIKQIESVLTVVGAR